MKAASAYTFAWYTCRLLNAGQSIKGRHSAAEMGIIPKLGFEMPYAREFPLSRQVVASSAKITSFCSVAKLMIMT